MPQPARTRTGMGRGAQPPKVRGIDLFNAAQKKAMVAKSKKASASANLPKLDGLPAPLPPAVPKGPAQETAAEKKIAGDCLSGGSQQVVQRTRKETPEEYRARHAAKADPIERANLLKKKALERERAEFLAGVSKEFKKRCLEEKLCLNCGWPGHRKQDCPDPPYLPVWSEDGELSFEPAKPKHDAPAQDTPASEIDQGQGSETTEKNEK